MLINLDDGESLTIKIKHGQDVRISVEKGEIRAYLSGATPEDGLPLGRIAQILLGEAEGKCACGFPYGGVRHMYFEECDRNPSRW